MEKAEKEMSELVDQRDTAADALSLLTQASKKEFVRSMCTCKDESGYRDLLGKNLAPLEVIAQDLADIMHHLCGSVRFIMQVDIQNRFPNAKGSCQHNDAGRRRRANRAIEKKTCSESS